MDIRRGGSYTSHSVGQNSKKVEFKAAAIFHTFIQAAMSRLWSEEIVIFYTEILSVKVVLWCFFSSETSGKNPQSNFSSQNLSLERNFFKWDGKETKILHLLFHRIWKKIFLSFFNLFLNTPTLRSQNKLIKIAIPLFDKWSL